MRFDIYLWEIVENIEFTFENDEILKFRKKKIKISYFFINTKSVISWCNETLILCCRVVN